MKKFVLSLVLIFFGVGLLVGCDDLKQVISDVAESEIENTVNDLLGLTEEESFQLPEAKRYESFDIKTDTETGEMTGLNFEVIEPAVTVEEYAEEMINTFAKGFEDEFDEEELQVEIDKIKEDGEWTYEYEGDVYKVQFSEILGLDGVTVEKWYFSFEVIYGEVSNISPAPEEKPAE